jgi:hypothetical protein
MTTSQRVLGILALVAALVVIRIVACDQQETTPRPAGQPDGTGLGSAPKLVRSSFVQPIGQHRTP